MIYAARKQFGIFSVSLCQVLVVLSS